MVFSADVNSSSVGSFGLPPAPLLGGSGSLPHGVVVSTRLLIATLLPGWFHQNSVVGFAGGRLVGWLSEVGDAAVFMEDGVVMRR